MKKTIPIVILYRKNNMTKMLLKALFLIKKHHKR